MGVAVIAALLFGCIVLPIALGERCDWEQINPDNNSSCPPGCWMEGKDSSACSPCPVHCTTCSEGPTCTECKAGRWGSYCEQNCEDSCLGDECSINYGVCLCKMGFFRKSNVCVPCPSSNCLVCRNDTCFKCVQGYTGRTCETRCDECGQPTSYGLHQAPGAILSDKWIMVVIGFAAVTLVSAIVIVTVVILRRKSRRENRDQTETGENIPMNERGGTSSHCRGPVDQSPPVVYKEVDCQDLGGNHYEALGVAGDLTYGHGKTEEPIYENE